MHSFVCELPSKEQDGSLVGPCRDNGQARQLGDYRVELSISCTYARQEPLARPICPPSCRSAGVLHPRAVLRPPRYQSRPPRPVRLPRGRQCTCTLPAPPVLLPSERAAALSMAAAQLVQTCLLRPACTRHPLDPPRLRCPTRACIAREGHFALARSRAGALGGGAEGADWNKKEVLTRFEEVHSCNDVCVSGRRVGGTASIRKR